MDKINEIISNLTLEEKAMLCSGADFWHTVKIENKGIPEVQMTDGPNGLRKEDTSGGTNIMQKSYPATCFPPAVTTASTWDTKLAEDLATAISNEAKVANIGTVLGPGTNIKRSPLCGRNFEYFSEDPYIASEMSLHFISAMQKNGVGCSLKHFCANSQEYNRMSIDSIVDERTLREIYLPAFEKSIKNSQPYQVMCSYNKLNGTYLSDSKKMLNDILREEWGFKGIVVSDWGAVNNRIDGIKAGMDLEMPGNGGINNRKILKAIENKELNEKDLDKVVYRLIDYALKCEENKKENYKYDFNISHKVAKKIATDGAVLLRNKDKILPISKKEKISLIGKLAVEPRYQGSGSSKINPINLVSIVDSLKEKNIQFDYCDGYTLNNDGYNKALIKEAIQYASKNEKVVLVLGLTNDYESEGFDRTHLNLPNGQIKLLDKLFKVNPNIIVLLQCGSPVVMPWIKQTKAILNLYLGGEAGGEAACDLLYGDACPSGKLAETFPLSLDNFIGSKYYPMGPRTVEYREGIYVGYRYYDSAKKEVLFPFGYGLSYTTFEYSNLKVSKNNITEDEGLDILFDIKNIGDIKGKETAQIYVRDVKSTIFKADRELKAFEKVELEPNETKTIKIHLNKRAFSYYNIKINDWHVESGDFEIMVGSSSRHMQLQTSVYVKSTNENIDIPNYKETASVYYNIASADVITKDEFKEIYGKPIPDGTPLKKGQYHINTTLGEVQDSFWGRWLLRIIKLGGKIVAGKSENSTMVIKTIPSMPFRSFSAFTGGILSMRSVNGLVMMINGHCFKGKHYLLTGLKKKYR